MNHIGKNDAFAKLHEYQKRSARFVPGSKSGRGPSDEWSGITFGLGADRLTCNIERVSEVLPYPNPTSVPGAKPWIIGLANVRGELLTVIDLGRYLTGVRSPISSKSRLLATSLNKAPIGLLIDEVFGQRHFLDSEAVVAELSDESPLAGIVSKRHQLGSETWLELDLDRLFNSVEFLHGAAH